MTTWTFDGRPLGAAEVGPLLVARLRAARFETVVHADDERVLSVVTNGHRALVMLQPDPTDDEPAAPAGHAVDPDVTGSSGGYRLGNGQEDVYDDRDTVPWDVAVALVTELVRTGRVPSAGWEYDG